MAVSQQSRALDALQHVLNPKQIVTDPVALLTYAGDAGLDRGHPDAVVFPRTAADLVRIVRWAQEHGVPLVARGAGTGLSGGAIAEQGGVILAFSRMEAITSFDARGGRVVAETGVVNLDLDRLVSQQGWYYPPDPSSGRAATLGGNIAENSGGPHCFKYGVTTNYVLGLEAVLADGRTLRLGGPAYDYPEYDLVGLLTGSEGTLALLTAAHLRLIRLPPALKTLIAAFETIEDAGQAVSDLIAHGLMPAAMEMMDRDFLRIVEDFTPAGLPIDAGAALIIEVDGYATSVSPQMDEIVTILRRYTKREPRVAQTADERARIWYGRKSAAGAIARLAPFYYLVDGTVPRSKLAPALTATNRICREQRLRVVYVFHAGDGNLHPLILIDDLKDQELIGRVIEAGRQIMEMCITHDGSITGEHGVGTEKRAYMPLMYTPSELQAMHDIKDTFDPQGMLNPAKILPSERPNLPLLPSIEAPPESPFAPETAEEAAEAIRAWAAASQPIRILGGGSKSRHLPATPAQLSTGNLRGIRSYARDDLYVTVGAGTPLAELHAELAADQMTVPLVSPWAASTVGGTVATNYNAPLRMRYGGLRDLVLSATVALPNGRVIRAGRPVVKNVAGYDLPKLFVGAHGTLGLLTEITLKLYPAPRMRSTLLIPVPGDTHADALQRGLDWGSQLVRGCLVASALLLCDQHTLATLPEPPATPYALVYTAEGLPEDVQAELDEVRHTVLTLGAHAPLLLASEAPGGSDLWAGMLRGDQADTEAAPLVRLGAAPGDLPDLVRGLAATLSAAPLLVDLPNGLLYTRVLGEPYATVEQLRAAAGSIGGYACVPTWAGTSAFDPWGYAPEGLPLMQALKARWDAAGVLNPGAFLV